MSKKAIKAVVKGRIQGVGYRANTHQKATQLGIKGYIRGTAGNKVEVVAEGNEEDLKKLINYLEEGPSGSEVENFDFEWIEPEGDFIRFAIKY